MRPSPLENRVTPEGEIIATPERGLLMGNRGGSIHGPGHRLAARRRFASRQWICCRLAFKGRRRELMQPGRYTELFFLDEATAFAAGHRPCFECRRADARLFQRLLGEAMALARPPSAPAIDRLLHAERLTPERGKRVHRLTSLLPAGTFIRHNAVPAVIVATGTAGGMSVRPWTPGGYGALVEVPAGVVPVVLTPPSTVAVLARGYPLKWHPTAGPALTPPA